MPDRGPPEGVPSLTDPCRTSREQVEATSDQARRMHALADAANTRLRDARRAWNVASEARDAAHLDTDRIRFTAAKEDLRLEYRRVRDAASSDEQRRAAATQWMLDIAKLNRQRARATIRVAQSGSQLARLRHVVDRLSTQADVARISAEAADHAWRETRLARAACEEMDSSPQVLSDDAYARPLIMRLVDGDRQMLPRVGAVLAYDAGIDVGHTQLLLNDLVEAIKASALEADAFDFPSDHPFWSNFSPEESRELLSSFRSLGYGPDGNGGWMNGRLPMLRDISLAISHLGLDPRRLRHLPTGPEIEELFRDVRLRGDRFLLFRAPDLSLSGMLAALGPRGDVLSPLWDAWGRLRPLLMTTGDVASIE